ncbi:protein of unknown function [Nitrospira japonica]|uniref:Uncharacterized protein n=1 Tax=Nitrospira japonica TaxID=1325564 RepID=A0A1W1I4Z7_9BACT|nr:protein of unknown function [Nitrospira japonica]
MSFHRKAGKPLTSPSLSSFYLLNFVICRSPFHVGWSAPLFRYGVRVLTELRLRLLIGASFQALRTPENW